jgi:hypothetical protein
MQILSGQIRLLEQEILAESPDSAQRPADLKSMLDLKKAVDGMRATLWCYLEGHDNELPACPEEIKLVRMNRVVEMFRTLKTTPGKNIN